MAERIGFIGLGIMGQPMARNLMRAGYELVVSNRNRGPVDALAAEGATPAGSPREVVEQSDIVITMLPDSPQVSAVVAGTDGMLQGARGGTLLIDMSTISPVVAQSLAQTAEQRGVRMLDAPVNGGGPGAGQVVKACNQVVVALTIEAVSEALVLGSKAGVDPAVILQVLSGGLAANTVMEVRGRNFLEHDFTPGFKIALHHKDLGIALAAAREYGVSLPVTALVDQMLQALRLKGQGDQDHSAVLTLLEDWAQHTIGSRGLV